MEDNFTFNEMKFENLPVVYKETENNNSWLFGVKDCIQDV